MVQINTSLTSDVKEFLASGDRNFLSHMKASNRNDIECQAVVRYLMQLKHWPLTPESEFAEVMEHLFGEYPERKKRDPKEYQATTFDLIKSSFDYECVEIIPAPAPVTTVEEKPKGRKTKKSTKPIEPEDHHEPESDIDTTGASDRLKRVIAIQRGS